MGRGGGRVGLALVCVVDGPAGLAPSGGRPGGCPSHVPRLTSPGLARTWVCLVWEGGVARAENEILSFIFFHPSFA